MFKGFNIPEIGPDCQFWMMRTKRGVFFNEFVTNGYIAIGWNEIAKNMLHGVLSQSQERALKRIIKEEYNEMQPGMALNKCLRFCNEVKTGDYVLIAGYNRIALAVVGEYFEAEVENSSATFELHVHQIIEDSPRTISIPCPYRKRREITVLRIIDLVEEYISPYLFKAIATNRHSLSSLNDYSEVILSSCHDLFIQNQKLSVTFHINKKDDIDALLLADFISDAAKLLGGVDRKNTYIKTNLHSPGDIILQVVNWIQSNAALVIILYFCVFGGKFKDFEFNSMIGLIKDIANNGHNKKMKGFEEERAGLENRKLLLETEKQQMENDRLRSDIEKEEREYQAEKKAIEESAIPVLHAARDLEIYPDTSEYDDSKIITIDQIRKEAEKTGLLPQ